jgi:hypothetical protein
MNAIQKFEHNGRSVAIYQDEDPESPRDWDNLGIMVCFHKRYTLGDDKVRYRDSDYASWDALEAQLKKDGAALILPLYLYDHSGISMSTSEFSCPWDSGQVGFIYVSRTKVLEEYSVKRLSKKALTHARVVLESEVKTYDQYLRGDVYGYDIEDGDSCWGFFGIEDCIAEAKANCTPEDKAVLVDEVALA